MPSTIKRGSHIPELDGIRGLAVWMVFGDHVLAGWRATPEALARIPKVVHFVLGHGWLGVDLFFVLSGFLITGILVDARDKPHYFRDFYARRFLRIIPLYFSVIAGMWLCYGGPAQYFLLSIFFLANFAAAFGTGVPHGAGVFWSLAVEEHFYLVWPLLVRLLSRRALCLFAASIVVVVPCVRLWAAAAGMDYDKIYSYSYFRFDGLALGALLAIWARSPRADTCSSLRLAGGLIACSLLLTIVGLPFGIMSQHSTLRFTQAELIFGGLILAAVELQSSAVTAPLRWSVAKLSGDLSYCAYLVHLGLGDGLERLRHAIGIGVGWGFGGGLGLMLLRGVALFAATVAVTLLSRRYLEQPMLRLKRHFEYRDPGSEKHSDCAA